MAAKTKAKPASKAKAAKSKAAKKTALKSKRPAKKVVSKFMAPMRLSPELGAVVGKGPMPRSEVVKKLWAYIKKNKLQDQKNKRNINADDNLKKVFGGKRTVTMFEMTKLVSKHLL